MVEKLVDSFLEKQLAAGFINQEDRAVYRYGYMLVLEMGLNLLIVTIIGIMTGWLPSILFFLVAFMPLRTYCGGYHASSFWKCAILSNLLIVATVAIFELWTPRIVVLIILACIGMGAILLKAPCQSAAKPICANESKRYRKIIYIILIMETILAVILWNFNMRLSGLIAGAFFVTGINVLVGSWKESKQLQQTKGADDE